MSDNNTNCFVCGKPLYRKPCDLLRGYSACLVHRSTARVLIREAATGKSKRERHRESVRKWARSNRLKVNQIVSKWRLDNLEHAKRLDKASRLKRPHQINAATSHYRASKRKACPSWLTSEHRAQIREFYADSVRLSQLSGVEHQVDHIVPLRGKAVSGLHVPWNLQVIRAAENIRKSNKFSAVSR